jgi:hypothetical protein
MAKPVGHRLIRHMADSQSAWVGLHVVYELEDGSLAYSLSPIVVVEQRESDQFTKDAFLDLLEELGRAAKHPIMSEHEFVS